MPKLSQKRQLTVPQTICEAIQLQPGDHVKWCQKNGQVYLVKITDDDLAGTLAHQVAGRDFPEADVLKDALRQRASQKHQA